MAKVRARTVARVGTVAKVRLGLGQWLKLGPEQ